MTIRERLAEVIQLKRRLTPNSLRQLRCKALVFASFLGARRVHLAENITLRDVLDYMDTWRFNDSTEINQVRTLKFLLKKLHREDIAAEIDTPKETKEGKERRKPCPYSAEEIRKFREVADPHVELFFTTSIQTGLAVCDLVQLTTANLREGCVVTRRQKTGKPVEIPVDALLYEKLRVVLPFYSGRHWHCGVVTWSNRMRVAQQKAGIWKRGNLIHRGRDSFVERQLKNGVAIQIVAARLGDLVTTVEKHYADLHSPLMREANLRAPVVTV